MISSVVKAFFFFFPFNALLPSEQQTSKLYKLQIDEIRRYKLFTFLLLLIFPGVGWDGDGAGCEQDDVMHAEQKPQHSNMKQVDRRLPHRFLVHLFLFFILNNLK